MDRVDFVLRRGFRNDDRARHTDLSRHPGYTLRHVARARGDHTLAQLVARNRSHRAGSTTNLERAYRLQVLELEPDLARNIVGLKAYQRRPHGDFRDSFARAANILERDLEIHRVTVAGTGSNNN